ncbi:group 1 glycosyl transferase [Celeribacter indicus]|uniref:Group 1 glycosyl transferase n=2 Tax=Celeribacter indicus TaxID=1208324 RepID=A0A0B5E2B8_9RHOB|nr:group 1 glycosyl transferase [Celeribacter indicus]
MSEAIAVRWSHEVIADNDAITEYVAETYGIRCSTIAYGGDHAMTVAPDHDLPFMPPERYAFALSRIEPENSVAKILEAFSTVPDKSLVYVGNWNNSDFGQRLRRQYSGFANIHMAEPIYDLAKLRGLREGADLYVHGHSAGGTNPALVEMMHFGLPIVAHGCVFNRKTTENEADYFETAEDLARFLANRDHEVEKARGLRMLEIARKRYTWDEIGRSYFNLIEKVDAN